LESGTVIVAAISYHLLEALLAITVFNSLSGMNVKNKDIRTKLPEEKIRARLTDDGIVQL
jgi:hypothetical protein